MPDVPAKPTNVFRVFIRASIHDVWKEITRTDAPIACFFNNRMHLGRAGLQPGSTIAMRTVSGKFTGVVGEILEVVPPTRFSHTFKFTNMDDPPCVVTYELRDVSGQTEFTLIISDVLQGSKTQKQMTQGGTLIVNTLKSVMETGRPSFGTRMLFVLFKLLEPISPAKCRSERWPVN
ncbi:MAG: SRPBCC domain-containing protein [Planctomycetota bacterium]|nr:SRPBCC domain-containing protein [Planctomycetota bacterium]